MRNHIACLLFLSIIVGQDAVAQDVEPLTPEVALRIAQLLEEFDPNTYSLQIPVQTSTGGTFQSKLGRAVGLGSLEQTSLEKEMSAAAAGTNSNINLFRTARAGTNSNINIFRSSHAGTNSNINIFKSSRAGTNSNINIFSSSSEKAGTNSNINVFANDNQAAAASELAMYLQTGPDDPRFSSLKDRSAPADDLNPLNAEDTARVAKLLEEFDPNSYSVGFAVTDSAGKISTARLGKAVGLDSLKQTELEKEAIELVAGTNSNLNVFKSDRAGTNSNINIFRSTRAGTNSNINIFRPSRAGTNSNINIFRTQALEAGTNSNINIFASDRQASSAQELNAIFQKAHSSTTR